MNDSKILYLQKCLSKLNWMYVGRVKHLTLLNGPGRSEKSHFRTASQFPCKPQLTFSACNLRLNLFRNIIFANIPRGISDPYHVYASALPDELNDETYNDEGMDVVGLNNLHTLTFIVLKLSVNRGRSRSWTENTFDTHMYLFDISNYSLMNKSVRIIMLGNTKRICIRT